MSLKLASMAAVKLVDVPAGVVEVALLRLTRKKSAMPLKLKLSLFPAGVTVPWLLTLPRAKPLAGETALPPTVRVPVAAAMVKPPPAGVKAAVVAKLGTAVAPVPVSWAGALVTISRSPLYGVPLRVAVAP